MFMLREWLKNDEANVFMFMLRDGGENGSLIIMVYWQKHTD